MYRAGGFVWGTLFSCFGRNGVAGRRAAVTLSTIREGGGGARGMGTQGNPSSSVEHLFPCYGARASLQTNTEIFFARNRGPVESGSGGDKKIAFFPPLCSLGRKS